MCYFVVMNPNSSPNSDDLLTLLTTVYEQDGYVI